MSARLLLLAMALAALGASCIDATHDAEVDALGAEKGSPGPTHRPGQPCVVCHGGSGPASSQFSIGGTVFAIQGQSDPLVNAIVHITDASGTMKSFTTNSAGNFFEPIDRWQPVYPLSKISVDCGTLQSQSPPYTCTGDMPVTASMVTHVAREGSCAGCHYGARSVSSPGAIYIATDPTDLPGAATGGP